MTTEVAEVLERAADLIEPEGAWTQALPPIGKLCAALAIHRAAGAPYTQSLSCKRKYGLAMSAMAVALRETGRGAGDRRARFLSTWNDDPSRTQAEVVDLLRRAAARARQEQR